MKKKYNLVFVLGTRPDLIRAPLILDCLKKATDIKLILVWTGQHYSDNLKGIFFRELNIDQPDIDLKCAGNTDAEISSQLIAKLYPVLEKINPTSVVFLGDTNTVTGCIAAAQLDIPIIHIEGCWHSYDWRLPEEKYRTMIDHLSDVIYTYAKEYKERGIAEGLNPKNIVVVGNPVVDVLNKYYFKRKKKLEKMATSGFFKSRNIKDRKYYLMTCHRRQNVHNKKAFLAIMNLVAHAKYPVYFPASYRTQKVIQEMNLMLPKNIISSDPVGYEEILILMTHSKGVITDSGTIVEETCVLNIPAVNMRKSTERPEIYDVKSCVKFDPDQPEKYTPQVVFRKLEKIAGTYWQHKLGDGKASERIANDIITRLRERRIRGFLPKDNHLPIRRSFIEDGIEI